MSRNKELAVKNIDKALKRIMEKDENALTYAVIALAYAVLNKDDGTRQLDLTLDRFIDSINRSTNFR